MTGEQCGAVMPGTSEHDVDASVPEFRCLLPPGHDAHHATIIEWRDQWPWFLERDAALEREAVDSPPIRRHR